MNEKELAKELLIERIKAYMVAILGLSHTVE
jgi:hypothetical protein